MWACGCHSKSSTLNCCIGSVIFVFICISSVLIMYFKTNQHNLPPSIMYTKKNIKSTLNFYIVLEVILDAKCN